MTEQFFIAKPTPTDKPVQDGGATFAGYRTADGRTLKWSGKLPLPEVGQRIYITMNGIGWAVVKGYFESEGYIGVMTLATRPPKWLRDQRQRDIKSGRPMPGWMLEGIGCEFGTEIFAEAPSPAQGDGIGIAMWCKDTINLLGGQFKGRAEVGWDSYDYTLPTGDMVTLRPNERWEAGDLFGIGSDSLWKAFSEKVRNWQAEQEQQRRTAERNVWRTWREAFGKLSAHLRAEGWGECCIHQNAATDAYPYPGLTIKVDGRSEVWVEFGQHAEVLAGGSKAGSAFTGMPSFRKMAKKRYQWSAR